MSTSESCFDRKKLVFSVGFKLLWLPIDPGYALFGAPQKLATFFKAPQRKNDLALRPGDGHERVGGGCVESLLHGHRQLKGGLLLPFYCPKPH